MASKLCFLAVVCAMVSTAYAKADGAPTDSCGDLVPQHGVDPQKGAAPYSIVISKKNIRGGDTVDVTVTGHGAEDKIKGFLMQAREGKALVGKFNVPPADKFMKAINCPSGTSNALTHLKHPENEDKKSFKTSWTAPRGYKGTIIFTTTIARDGGTFWVAVPSEPLRVY